MIKQEGLYQNKINSNLVYNCNCVMSISKIYAVYNLRAHILAKIREIKINIKISWQVFILVRLSYVWTEG